MLIMDALPTVRSSTYLSIAKNYGQGGNTIVLAARLYVWNGYLASAVDRATGEVEVLLRNYMDVAFADWNSSSPRNGSREWIINPVGVLKELVVPQKGKPLMEHAHIESVEGKPVHDDYVAGLTFGNWVHLLPKPFAGENNNRVNLWNEALKPNLCQTNPDRVKFQSNAMQVKNMRNRATHRRPLIKDLEKLETTHQSCVEIAKSINPQLGEWLRTERWIPNALKECPLKIKDGPSY